MVDEGPTLRRRRLGAELKRCRENAKLTQEYVSRHFEWHAAKVTRIETARVTVTPRDVRDLLTLYGVDDEPYREALLELARQSKERSWWTDYRDVMRGAYVGLEDGAAAMRSFEPLILPGLLQTRDYMAALMHSGRAGDPPADIDRRIALRLQRQERRLRGTRPIQLTAVIDESVLRRTIGGVTVMRDQLRHLVDIAQSPNVTIRVLPLDFGAHLFLSGPAALLEFPESTQSDVVYLEGLGGDFYEEQPSEVARYGEEFDRLYSGALDHHATLKMIESFLEE